MAERKSDARFDGLRESPTTALYLVPYTAPTPGFIRGSLRIFATDTEDATERARAWHALRTLAPTYSARRARKAAPLLYGPPVRVGGEAGTSVYTTEAA